MQPSRRDRRFADPCWAGNPRLRRVMQAYLAATETAGGLAADADLDWADTQRVNFVLENLVDAMAPSNNPLLNPAALKAAINTGGGSILAGLRHFASDMAAPPRVPKMVEPDAFEVGVDLAITPGSVVLRTPVFELIQYRPATATVQQIPLLIIPPTINKFYVIDLAPGRSLAEYLIGQGLQVFMVSWRNPDARHAKWGFETYGQAILDAMNTVGRITRTERTALMGCCWAASCPRWSPRTWRSRQAGPDRRALPDGDRAGPGAGGPVQRPGQRAERAAGRGRVPGPRLPRRAVAGRGVRLAAANNLVWNYWVNDYLLGASRRRSTSCSGTRTPPG